ncbi:hypothetical protein [Pinibacter soli]|nr:hypothetical protein [Pinibacter soli]
MRTDVIELKKDIRNNKCKKLAFQAHKFYHALVNKYLLDYPGKEHMYIEVSPDDFNIIGDSETLYLITPIISSEIICLQKENGEIIRAFDFSFRNDRIPKGKP